jgi:putative FmdB family regulatory protein
VPIYEFECERCGARFDELTTAGERPACPKCSAPDVRRIFSTVARTPRLGLRGADARRSEAKRRAERERSAERRKGDR